MMNYARIQDGQVVEIILPAIDDEGAEIAIERRFHPDFVATLVKVPADAEVLQGDTWTEAAGFGPPPTPPAPPPPTATEVLAQRNVLLGMATLQIDPLSDAVELDVATPAEVAALKAWRQYRVSLMRLEQQAGFPIAVEWPKAPA